MATLIPDTPKDCTRSERLVFQRLGRELDPSWIVLHSLGLTDHRVKIRGEADLVVLSERGIFALEVKGGHVSCRDGMWHFGSPDGRSYSRAEDPWSQASGAMFAIRKRVIAVEPALEELLFGFGVVMPMERFTAVGEEIDPEVLLDKRNFRRNLGFYIGDLERRWKRAYFEKHGREPRKPTLEELRRIRQILRPDFESSFSLGSWLTGLDSEMMQLTTEQIRISRRLASNPRMVVKGRAGTGKTVLAVERALDLAAQGKSVLFLCFNQLLARHVAESLSSREKASRVTVRHVHGHYRDVIERAGLMSALEAGKDSTEDYFGEFFPRIYTEAVLEIEPPLFDAVVIDEAQDILTLPHLDAIDLTIAGGLEEGHWHLFLDPLQNVYGAMASQAEARLEAIGFARDELTDNCRNTRDVAVQTSILSMMDLPTDGALKGPACSITYFDDDKDCLRRLDVEVNRLLRQEVAAKDLIILSTRKLEKSSLAGRTAVGGLLLRDVAEPPAAGTIAFSTMHAFKGLERSIVLAIDLAEVGQDEWSMIHYAGLSRARLLLVPFVPRSLESRCGELLGAYGARLGAK